MTRGEVWLSALDPTIGSEIKKTRPCVVVSPPELNKYLRTVIVAPMTTAGRPAHFRVAVTFAGDQRLIVLDQMRTVDKSRLVKRLGKIDAKTVNATLAALRELFEE